MDNDKNVDFDDNQESNETEHSGNSATRARNRTVMLTPEVTGEVRARPISGLGRNGDTVFLKCGS